jgi:octopine/nopaline transport system substrate-binding protein
MRRSAVLAAVAVASFATAASGQDWSAIRVATEGAYPPWNATDSSGELIGFEVDLMADLCARMEAECELVAQDWDGIIPALTAGKYDAIMAGMSITEEREEVISFSACYADEPAKFAVLQDSDLASIATDLENINLAEVEPEEEEAIAVLKEALDGTTVGVQVATTHTNFLSEYFGEVVEIRNYDTQENLDLDLEAGRVDAALASMSYWEPLMATDKGANLTVVGPGMNGGPFGRGVGVGIRQEDAALAEKFNAAIEAARADGTLDRLTTEWFGFAMPCS